MSAAQGLASTRSASHLAIPLKQLEPLMMIATAPLITSVILNIARTTCAHHLVILLTSRDHTQTSASVQLTQNVVLRTALTTSASQTALPPMHMGCTLIAAIAQ